MISSIKNIFRKISGEYEKRYSLYTGLAAGLFLLQVVHLYWLTTHVVFHRLFGFALFDPGAFLQALIILVDYTEIPAIIGTSLVYIFSLRKQWNIKDLVFLLLLNSQWLHIFWISDEFVVDMLSGAETNSILPFWLAWVAIGIDYLELPVMYDTTKKFILSLSKNKNGNNII